MPIDDIKPTEPVKAYIGNKPDKRKKRAYSDGGFYGDEFDEDRSLPRGVNDITSFMGIPQDELTPAVTDAIISLMEELDGLREQLAHTHSLEDMLSDNVDKHQDLPVLTRHALIKEIALMCAYLSQSESHSTFVYFRIHNSSEIKARSGLLAYEAVLSESAEILKDQLRETDHIGTLGGDGFGIILSLTDEKLAMEKVKKLVELVQFGPLMYDGHVIDVKIAYGIHAMHSTEDVTSVLKATDRDLHRRFIQT